MGFLFFLANFGGSKRWAFDGGSRVLFLGGEAVC
jgi:hypothetical protein